MSHLLVIGFANEQKARDGANKLLSLQNLGQIEIQDALIATKDESGAVKLRQLSNASSFWEIRAAASGYPAPPAVGALTDFGGDEKFVKEIAEAMPSGRAAVFMLVAKKPKGGVFDGSTAGDNVVFFELFRQIRCRHGTGCFCQVEGERTGLMTPWSRSKKCRFDMVNSLSLL